MRLWQRRELSLDYGRGEKGAQVAVEKRNQLRL
jgi:hypothetical protein